MEQKINLRDAAKDLGADAAEVGAIIKEYLGVERKPTAKITADEFCVALEKITQNEFGGDIEEYLKSRGEKPAQKADKSKAVKTAAPKSLLKTPKPKAAKPETAVTDSDKPVKKSPKPKKENKDVKEKIVAVTVSENEITVKKEEPAAAHLKEEKAAETPKRVIPVSPPKPPKPPKKKPVPKPVQAAVDVNSLKINDPPKTRQKGEAVQHGAQITKRVNTRGSYVETDKYNEKYEKIASGQGGRNHNDGFGRKQKLDRKSPHHKVNRQPVRQKETESQKLKRLELERARSQQLKALIPEIIVVSELASRLKVTASAVIKKLFNLGVMANQNQTVDFDTASIVAEEFGVKVEKEIIITIEERLFEEIEDTAENLRPRSPVVVVMGHVDHGKTSLLDSIRDTDVVSGEAGGITQHIGAHRVHAGGKDITFLDTPGHEAFTAMRARGASVTDIAILVVAADDGIMPQTIEAINHAKAANVAIIVAINKIDKEGANPQRIKQELTEHGLLIEEWGGDVICCEVSAKKKIGLEHLLEMVNLTAEVLELKANPDKPAAGAVIEARLDKGRGPVATLLVQKGTLKTGDILIAGTAVGRVRVMHDDKGKAVRTAGPSIPVEITGMAEVPSAGDKFSAVADEKLARELVEKRKHEAKEAHFKQFKNVTLDTLFSHIEKGTVKELPIIVKADVQGSVEAVRQSLEKLSHPEVRIRVIHGGVGAVSESDVMLANASGAIIVGFNVRPHPAAAENAKRDNVEIRVYRVIYDAIEEIETAMKGMLAPKFKEKEMARIEVRAVYKITGAGIVAGCHVVDGKVSRNCDIRVVRDGIIIADDKIKSIKRFKDDVKEVAQGYECGISLEKFSDIKEGDVFEAYLMEQVNE